MFLGHFVTLLALSLCWCPVPASSIPGSALAIRENNASQPILPKQDPWYTAPPGFESMAPGTILRLRPAPGNLTTVVKNCSAAYNVLFRTTNSRMEPAFAVTTVFLPPSVDAGKSPSLLSYQIPYNTADVDGSPSYFLYEFVLGNTDIQAALGQGWAVSVPDFEGPLASFLMGLTEGHAVLDSVRSVLSCSKFGLSPHSSKVALWGYSGGSIASMFAIELHAQYAPELTLHGAAIGGTVPSFFASVPLANGSPQAFLLPAAFLGLTSQSSTARELLNSSLHPNNASQFMEAANYPLTQLQGKYIGTDITSFFFNYSSFLFDPEIQALQRDNWHLGYHGIPHLPIFMYKAIEDQISPVEEVDELVHRWCSLGGLDIRYERNRIGGHASEYQNGAPRAQQFLASILDGSNIMVPIHGGCVTQDVSIGPHVSPT